MDVVKAVAKYLATDRTDPRAQLPKVDSEDDEGSEDDGERLRTHVRLAEREGAHKRASRKRQREKTSARSKNRGDTEAQGTEGENDTHHTSQRRKSVSTSCKRTRDTVNGGRAHKRTAHAQATVAGTSDPPKQPRENAEPTTHEPVLVGTSLAAGIRERGAVTDLGRRQRCPQPSVERQGTQHHTTPPQLYHTPSGSVQRSMLQGVWHNT